MASAEVCAWCSKAGAGAEEICTKDAWLARGALAACSRCHSAHYCSRACQKRHFPVHRRECARLEAVWLATEAERTAARARANEAAKARLGAATVRVRELLAEIEAGLTALDPSASLRWSQRRPGRVDIVEVWLLGRRYTGFDAITEHTCAAATLKVVDFRMTSGTYGYGCPCHGFNLLLLTNAGGSTAGGAAGGCPYGGAGGGRGRAPARMLAGTLPAGFIARAAVGSGAPPLPPPSAAPLAPLAFGLSFSCEPCDPDEAAALAEALAPSAPPRTEPHLYELSAFGFSCTPCDPDDLELKRGETAPPLAIPPPRQRADDGAQALAACELAGGSPIARLDGGTAPRGPCASIRCGS